MIIGIGNDVVDLRRLARVVERYPRRFPARVLTAAERQCGQARPAAMPAFLAGRWAAKEALGKALGCGVRAPLSWRQVAVLPDDGGRPRFEFSPAAAAFVRACGVSRCHLSISHDGDYACAVVVAEGEGNE